MLKRQSRFLAEGVAWSRRWLAHGLMTMEEQREFEHKFAPLPALISSAAIRRIRRGSCADEVLFARTCSTSSNHVRRWEARPSHPRGPELKLIHLARRRGLDVVSPGADR